MLCICWSYTRHQLMNLVQSYEPCILSICSAYCEDMFLRCIWTAYAELGYITWFAWVELSEVSPTLRFLPSRNFSLSFLSWYPGENVGGLLPTLVTWLLTKQVRSSKRLTSVPSAVPLAEELYQFRMWLTQLFRGTSELRTWWALRRLRRIWWFPHISVAREKSTSWWISTPQRCYPKSGFDALFALIGWIQICTNF